MEQKFSSFRVMAAANHSKNSAMEAENHVKHGKSHTSRRCRKSLALFILLIGAIVFSSCDKDKEDGDSDVYVVGRDGDRAVLWKNGVVQILGDGRAESVFVSGSDVYVAGRDGDRAVLWKNGLAQYLTDGSNWAWANSVFVSGSDVYVAGFVAASIGAYGDAVLWKNGMQQNLTKNDFFTSSSANSVFVSGNDVYVAGGTYFDGGVEMAELWKNGETQILTLPNGHTGASSVFVSGGDVYVPVTGLLIDLQGEEWVFITSGVLCKNGVAQYLFNDESASSVFVSGSDVYVVGSKTWKNGEVLYNNGGNSIYVSGSDIYVAGYIEGHGAVLWKNGEQQILSDDGSTTSVFVVKK